MSEEEKKAIEDLKNLVSWKEQKPEIRYYELEAINTIINLTDKQQKEIEELHKEINQRIKLKLENEKCAEKDFVYKGKIKEKMREIMGYTFTTSEERHCQNYAYDRLKELLEGK